MQLSIIIVNYKTPDLTFRCIKSIYESEISFPFEIIIVDNDSQDGSKDLITTHFSEVKWISNDYNAGFGRANNIGVSQAKGKYVLLLNSDMLLLNNQKLEDCISLFENDSDTGVVGCKLLNEDNSIQKSIYYDVATIRYLLSYNILWYKLFKPTPKSFDAVMGSFMLFRKKDFEKIKGFDEDFFMYAEELELCYRIKKSGKKIVFFDGYTAIHKHGGSSQGSDWSQRQNMLSNALLYLKIRGWAGYFLYHFVFHINVATNLLLFFTLSVESRKSYIDLYKSYFCNYKKYLRIPFYYIFTKKEKRIFLTINN